MGRQPKHNSSLNKRLVDTGSALTTSIVHANSISRKKDASTNQRVVYTSSYNSNVVQPSRANAGPSEQPNERQYGLSGTTSTVSFNRSKSLLSNSKEAGHQRQKSRKANM